MFIVRESDDVACPGPRLGTVACGDRTQHPDTADTRKDDLDDGAVEELLFSWLEG